MEQKKKKERFANVIAVYNRKGGVGKTYVSVSLAAYLAKNINNRVLFIDADSQCNASCGFLGLDKEKALDASLYPSILNLAGIKIPDRNIEIQKLPWQKIISKSPNYNLFTVYGNKATESLWNASETTAARYDIISEFVEEVRDKFDYIVIDMGPNDSHPIIYNSLFASDYVLIVSDTSSHSLEGVEDFYRDMWPTIKESNPYCRSLGVVINKYNEKSFKSFLVDEIVPIQQKYGFKVFEDCIPMNPGAVKCDYKATKEEAKCDYPILFFHPQFKRKYPAVSMRTQIAMQQIIIEMSNH